MTINYLEQPQDKIIKTRNGDMLVKWKPNFARQRNNNYNRAQRFVDARVLYYSERYIPIDTGELLMSGRRLTRIGSGLVMWRAQGRPYTRPQYYGWRNKPHVKVEPNSKGKKVYGKKAHPGKWWFKRMKSSGGKQIVTQAKAIAGGGSR